MPSISDCKLFFANEPPSDIARDHEPLVDDDIQLDNPTDQDPSSSLTLSHDDDTDGFEYVPVTQPSKVDLHRLAASLLEATPDSVAVQETLQRMVTTIEQDASVEDDELSLKLEDVDDIESITLLDDNDQALGTHRRVTFDDKSLEDVVLFVNDEEFEAPNGPEPPGNDEVKDEPQVDPAAPAAERPTRDEKAYRHMREKRPFFKDSNTSRTLDLILILMMWMIAKLYWPKAASTAGTASVAYNFGNPFENVATAWDNMCGNLLVGAANLVSAMVSTAYYLVMVAAVMLAVTVVGRVLQNAQNRQILGKLAVGGTQLVISLTAQMVEVGLTLISLVFTTLETLVPLLLSSNGSSSSKALLSIKQEPTSMAPAQNVPPGWWSGDWCSGKHHENDAELDLTCFDDLLYFMRSFYSEGRGRAPRGRISSSYDTVNYNYYTVDELVEIRNGFGLKGRTKKTTLIENVVEAYSDTLSSFTKVQVMEILDTRHVSFASSTRKAELVRLAVEAAF